MYRLGRALRSLVVRPLTAAAERLGGHPLAPLFALRYGRRGNLVNAIRRQTGLGTMPLGRVGSTARDARPPRGN